METYEQLVSRVNAYSFLYDEPTTKHPQRRKSKRLQKVKDAVASLPLHKLEILKELLTGKRVLVGMYAVKRTENGWRICNTSADSEGKDHTVYLDLSACSCKDSTFRNRKCKHICALEPLA